MAPDHPTHPMRAHSAMERWLLLQIEAARGVRFLSAESTFETLGFKPLDFIELVMTAEEYLGIEIPDDVALPCKSPAELAARLVERSARPGAARA